MIKLVNDLIQFNRNVAADDIAKTLSLSVGTEHKIVHDEHGYWGSIGSATLGDSPSKGSLKFKIFIL